MALLKNVFKHQTCQWFYLIWSGFTMKPQLYIQTTLIQMYLPLGLISLLKFLKGKYHEK